MGAEVRELQGNGALRISLIGRSQQEEEAVIMEKRGTGITYVKVVVNLLIMALLILCCFLVLPRIIVYFMPFFIGWIISLIANPIVDSCCDHCRTCACCGWRILFDFLAAGAADFLYK